MKKSLLIAPALGVLVLAAAGSVGGTVAWFTANTEWTMTAQTFAITKLDGSLSATLTADIGTYKTADNAVQVKTKTSLPEAEEETFRENKLTHGAIDVKTGNLYVKNGDDYVKKGDTSAATGWIGRPYSAGQVANDTYYAVTWKVTFSYKFESDITDINLYFDKANSTATRSGSGDVGHFAHKGFRIGMIGSAANDSGAGSYTRVWAPFSTEQNHVEKKAAANDGEAVSTYSGRTFIGSDFTASAIGQDEKGSNEVGDCIGQFHAAAVGDSINLAYTFAAWFEGEDSNVVDDAALEAVTCGLKFYTRQDNGLNPQP